MTVKGTEMHTAGTVRTENYSSEVKILWSEAWSGKSGKSSDPSNFSTLMSYSDLAS